MSSTINELAEQVVKSAVKTVSEAIIGLVGFGVSFTDKYIKPKNHRNLTQIQ